MPMCFVRITSRPGGEAPEAIRDKWVGLVLPVDTRSDGMYLSGVVTGKNLPPQGNGYAVRWPDAMNILGRSHPEAREWWERNSLPCEGLVFFESCCEVVPD